MAMDFLFDPIFSDLSRSDFIGGIDNEALDFGQLEQYMEVASTVENLDDPNNNNSDGSNARHHRSNSTTNITNNNNKINNSSNSNSNSENVICNPKTESPTAPSNIRNETNIAILNRTNDIGNSAPVLTLNSTTTSLVNNQGTLLPESPPDSGSEQPYSPLQDVHGLTLTSRETYNNSGSLVHSATALAQLHHLQQRHFSTAQQQQQISHSSQQQQHIQQSQNQHHFPHQNHSHHHNNAALHVITPERNVRIKHEAGLLMNPTALMQQTQQQTQNLNNATNNNTSQYVDQQSNFTTQHHEHQLLHPHMNISIDNSNILHFDNLGANGLFAGGFSINDIQSTVNQETPPCMLSSIGDVPHVQVVGTSHTPKTAPPTPVHLSSSRKRKLSTQLECSEYDSIKSDPGLLSIGSSMPRTTNQKLMTPTSPVGINIPTSTHVIDVSSTTPTHSVASASPALSTINSNVDTSLDGNVSSNNNISGTPESASDPIDPNALMPCIRFSPFQPQNWHKLCAQSLQELDVVYYRVDADKGFNFSVSDDAFVCQKKNHFQITCHARLQGDAKFVKTPSGLEKIKSFHLHFYGVKLESPNQTIRVEQSQSDRSKKPFFPVPLDLQSHIISKITVGRLHFSETTNNNMRKKGRPNPEQRYFQLVVGLHVHTMSGNFPVISQASERIIVRASNPGQFESDVDLCWQRGLTQDSIYHAGRVGINTDRPDESLVVHGNLKVSGHIVQPSDSRAKQEIGELDTSVQLRNLQKIRIVRYRYEPEFALHSGLKRNSESESEEIVDTGVIAQEVREVIPDAVQEGGRIVLPNGNVIENFLLVNKDRILMENIGAVKELCKVTGSLETRIEHLERINNHLSKGKSQNGLRQQLSPSCTKHDDFEICSNRSLQIVILLLVIVMAACLAAVSTLYFIEHNKQYHNLKQLQSLQILASSNLFSPDSIRINEHERHLIELHNILKLNNHTNNIQWPNFFYPSTTVRSLTLQRNNTYPNREITSNDSTETQRRTDELVVVMDKPVVREPAIRITTTAPLQLRNNKTISSKNKSKWPGAIRAAVTFAQQKEFATTQASPSNQAPLNASSATKVSEKAAETIPLPQDFENNSIDMDAAHHGGKKQTTTANKADEPLGGVGKALNEANTAHDATLLAAKDDSDIALKLTDHIASTSSSNSINIQHVPTATAHGLRSNIDDPPVAYNLYKTLPPTTTISTTASSPSESEGNVRNDSLDVPPISNKSRDVFDGANSADSLDLQNLNNNNDSADNPISALFSFDFDSARDSSLGRRPTSQGNIGWIMSKTKHIPPFGGTAHCTQQRIHEELSNCQSLCFEESNQLQPLVAHIHMREQDLAKEHINFDSHLNKNVDQEDFSASVEENSDSAIESDEDIYNGNQPVSNTSALEEKGKLSHPRLYNTKKNSVEIESDDSIIDTSENLHSLEILPIARKSGSAESKNRNSEALSVAAHQPTPKDCWIISATIYAEELNSTFGVEDFCPSVGKSLNLTYVIPLSRFLKELSVELHLSSSTPLLWTICNDHEHTKREGKHLIKNSPRQAYQKPATLIRRQNSSMLLLNFPSRGFFMRDLALRGTNNMDKQNICNEQATEGNILMQYNIRILRDCD